MGTLFMVNPPKRKKRRTAAQRRATAKMIAANKRGRRKYRKNPLTAAQRRKRYAKSLTVGHSASKRRRTSTKTSSRKRKGTKVMAKKRRSTKRRSTKRRSSSARRGVSTLRRHSVYLTNPRRRRRARPAAAKRRRKRSGYSRNPSIIATLRQGAMDAGATLVGGAVARVITGFVPLPKDGIAGVATGLGVALTVSFGARKVVKGDTARFIVAGAMQVPIKALITTFVPGAGAYLGDYDNMGAYALPSGNVNGMGDYLSPGGNIYTDATDTEIGVYE